MEIFELLLAFLGAIFKRRPRARRQRPPRPATPSAPHQPLVVPISPPPRTVAPHPVAASTVSPAAPDGEASMVASLFASPRTVAAAFIVGEVLAAPLALRADR